MDKVSYFVILRKLQLLFLLENINDSVIYYFKFLVRKNEITVHCHKRNRLYSDFLKEQRINIRLKIYLKD